MVDRQTLTSDARAPLLALGVVLVTTAVALPVCARLPLGPIVSPAGAFGGAVLTSFAALLIGSRGAPSRRVGWAMLLVGALTLGAAAWAHSHHPAVGILIDLALVAITQLVGGFIGRRIEDAGHLFPAAVVAGAADIVSVLSPEGPSHAISQSEQALSLAAFSFPAPGTFEMVPAIGAGDLTMVALFLAAARNKGISARRVAGLALLGALLSGGLSAILGRAIPALPLIGLMVILGVPQVRRLRPKDRGVAYGAMVIAGAVVIAVGARAMWG